MTPKTYARAVMFVAYNKGEANVMKKKIDACFSSFEALTFEIPRNNEEIMLKIRELSEDISESQIILEETQSKIDSVSAEITEIDKEAGFSKLELWKKVCLKDKVIFENLNLFKMKDNLMTCKFWCPECLH